MKAAAILLIISPVVAVGADRSTTTIRMPLCEELKPAAPMDLVAYLGNDPKALSLACAEFAIRKLTSVTNQMSVADSKRAIEAVMPFLNVQSLMVSGNKWYPAKNAIVALTNSAVQMLEDAHQNSAPMREFVAGQLIALIADTTASEIAADSAAWALDEVMAFPDSPSDGLPAVQLLASAARQSNDASSSKRLWEKAKKLADTCWGADLQRRCAAALN
ncbi:MAG TPA: hypothetical protein VHC72_04375 [Bryobacteraceae bacterium]|nr:hypothetical protein [Bryobacteraceae bacterium]